MLLITNPDLILRAVKHCQPTKTVSPTKQLHVAKRT